MIEIHPKEIKGAWDQGYILDVHTISSTMIGYNEFGHPEFDTVRSQLGELIYRLKYKGDKAAIVPAVEAVAAFVNDWGIHPDAIVPMPPSKGLLNNKVYKPGSARYSVASARLYGDGDEGETSGSRATLASRVRHVE